MRRFKFMLPHKWNVISCSWIAFYVLLQWFFHLAMGMSNRDVYAYLGPDRLIASAFCLINTIMLCMACFSEEKYEDERVSHVRFVIIGAMAVILLSLDAMRVISSVFSESMHMRVSNIQSMVSGDFPLIVIIYLASLKIWGWVDNRLSRDEK